MTTKVRIYQIESFKEYLSFDAPTHLIVLEASDEIVRQRMLKRGRHDDQENAINTRLRLYREIDEQTIGWVLLHTDIPVIRIDVSRSIEEETSAKVAILRLTGTHAPQSHRLFQRSQKCGSMC